MNKTNTPLHHDILHHDIMNDHEFMITNQPDIRPMSISFNPVTVPCDNCVFVGSIWVVLDPRWAQKSSEVTFWVPVLALAVLQ